MGLAVGDTRVLEELARTERLYELGIAEEVLRTAVRFGAQYAGDCTKHDPPNLAGILAWGKTMRSLRRTRSIVPSGARPSRARPRTGRCLGKNGAKPR